MGKKPKVKVKKKAGSGSGSKSGATQHHKRKGGRAGGKRLPGDAIAGKGKVTDPGTIMSKHTLAFFSRANVHRVAGICVGSNGCRLATLTQHFLEEARRNARQRGRRKWLLTSAQRFLEQPFHRCARACDDRVRTHGGAIDSGLRIGTQQRGDQLAELWRRVGGQISRREVITS